MRTRIKICGMTRVEDIRQAVELGVDAIGLVFYQPSRRYVDIGKAEQLLSAVPPFVTTVGLFLDAGRDEIRGVVDNLRLDCLQFHGRETTEFCESFGRPYIKSINMMDIDDVVACINRFPGASGFLLDAVHAGEAGGKGRVFDWHKVPADSAKPLILAGGLTVKNVAEAIRQTHCYAVDVSSGVELEKGIKSGSKMREFIQQVNSVR